MNEYEMQKLAAASRFYLELEKDAMGEQFIDDAARFGKKLLRRTPKKAPPTLARSATGRSAGLYGASKPSTLSGAPSMYSRPAPRAAAPAPKRDPRQLVRRGRVTASSEGAVAPTTMPARRPVRAAPWETKHATVRSMLKLAMKGMLGGGNLANGGPTSAVAPPPPKKMPSTGAQFTGTTPVASGGLPKTAEQARPSLAGGASVGALTGIGAALGAESLITGAEARGLLGPKASRLETNLAKNLLRAGRPALKTPTGVAAAAGVLGGILGATGAALVGYKQKQAALRLTPLRAALGSGTAFGAGFGAQRYMEAKPGPKGFSKGEKGALLDLHRQLLSEQVEGQITQSDLKSRDRLVGNLAAKAEQRKSPVPSALAYGGGAAAVGAGTAAMSAFLAPKIIKAIRNVR